MRENFPIEPSHIFYSFIPADKDSETDLIRKMQAGDSTSLLPETTDQLNNMIQTLTVTRPRVPKLFLNGMMEIRLRLLVEHKKGEPSSNLYQ